MEFTQGFGLACKRRSSWCFFRECRSSDQSNHVRQAALGAGIPNSVVCTIINKVCSSGMKATMVAALSIQAGANDIVVAGGLESMSNVPKYLPNSRKGSRLGHDSLVDGMIKDGLWDVYNDFGMGVCGELCADTYKITSHQQDDYAVRSFSRGIAAQNNGAFKWEVKVSAEKGKVPTIVDKDEALTKFDATKLRKLRPSFKVEGGTVTGGNASSISDGAAALVLVSGEKALELGFNVIARIKSLLTLLRYLQNLRLNWLVKSCDGSDQLGTHCTAKLVR